jgi:hypothetical protein
MFLWSIPVFIVSVGLEMWHRNVLLRALPFLVGSGLCAAVMTVVISHHNSVFMKKYSRSKQFEAEQFNHLSRMDQRQSAWSSHLGVSGI